MSEVSFPPQEHTERGTLLWNNGARIRVVADAFTTCEPCLGRRGLAPVRDRAGNCPQKIRRISSPVLGGIGGLQQFSTDDTIRLPGRAVTRILGLIMIVSF